MIQKIKKNLIDFFHNPKDIIAFFTPLLCALILIMPVPYVVTAGGGIINIDEKINISNEHKSSGSFNATYVKELNGNVLTYLLSYVIPSYELNKVEDVVLENEDEKDYNFREKMSFNTSTDSAIKVAYETLNKDIKIEKTEIYVIYIEKRAQTNLKAGDKLIKVNNQYLTKIDEVHEIISNFEGSKINFTVIRDNKEINCEATMIEIDNEQKAGIYLTPKYTYKVNPSIDFKWSDKEIGPSGGLIMTLSIYNKLTKEDITKGYKISGTGTIDSEGNVGEIGGVTYKLTGAVRKKSDIFFCPKENYDEAKKFKKEKKYDIDIYGVKDFNEALEILQKLTKK